MLHQIQGHNIETKRGRVLVCPLDWGLGHATRCIPIIKYLLLSDCEVIIAAEGKQAALLQTEFPQINIIPLRGYRLKFGKSGWLTTLRIIGQIPKILTAIKQENRWLKRWMKENRVDAIISDNRYGLFQTEVPGIFITHQLYIKTPFGRKIEALLQRINYYYINRYSTCWVPDDVCYNWAGELSMPEQFPAIPVHYIGPLSRLKKENEASSSLLLILLSGLEPQRSIFENLLLEQLQHYHEPVVMVRGLPGEATALPSFNQVTIYNHLDATALNRLVNKAGIVISRSGYSTVMDVLPLEKRCVFVPTPGQTEQAYLADWLAENRYCTVMQQDEFNLQQALQQATTTTPVKIGNDITDYASVMKLFITALDSRKTKTA